MEEKNKNNEHEDIHHGVHEHGEHDEHTGKDAHHIHEVHEKPGEEHHEIMHKAEPRSKGDISKLTIGLIVLVTLLILFNQYQFYSVSKLIGGTVTKRLSVSNVEFSSITSTAQSLNALFPIKEIKTTQDAVDMLLPTGTPDYGAELGVSYEDPVASLAKLSKMYPSLKAEVQKNNPEAWQRFMDLASKPVGISCEYCCGVGPIGIDKNGNSKCGCQHNPALLSIALYLTAYTDYSDEEVLAEVLKWKTLFFPKNMIGLAMEIAGGDAEVLKDLPGMVGGC